MEIWSIFVGVGVGAGVGLIAGVYPASRASLLDPIAAMRQEYLMSNLGVRVLTLFEGVAHRARLDPVEPVRAALTILGIAVGVFVVVVISAAIHGINASVARDFEKAGPDDVLPVALSDHVRGVRRHGRHLQVAPQPATSI